MCPFLLIMARTLDGKTVQEVRTPSYVRHKPSCNHITIPAKKINIHYNFPEYASCLSDLNIIACKSSLVHHRLYIIACTSYAYLSPTFSKICILPKCKYLIIICHISVQSGIESYA